MKEKEYPQKLIPQKRQKKKLETNLTYEYKCQIPK